MVAEKQAHAAVRCVLDRAGRFTAVAPWLCEATGWSSEALLSRPVTDWLHPEDRDPVMAELGMLSPAAGPVPIESRFRQASGAYRWLTWILWLDADTVQARVWDAAASRAAQQRVEEVRRCYGSGWTTFYFDSLVHLVVINAMMELLIQENELDARAREILERAVQAVNHVGDMRNELREVFIALGESRAHERPVSLPPLLDDVVTELRAFYGAQHIELAYRPADELPAWLLARERSLRVASKYLLQACPVLPNRCDLSASRYPVERVVFDVGLQDGRLVLRATASGGAGPVPDISSFEPDIVFEEILRQLGAKLHVEPRADGWSLWFSIEYVSAHQEPS